MRIGERGVLSRRGWLMTTRRAAWRERYACRNLRHSACRTLARGFFRYSIRQEKPNGAERERENPSFFGLSDCTLPGGDGTRDLDRPPDPSGDQGESITHGDFITSRRVDLCSYRGRPGRILRDISPIWQVWPPKWMQMKGVKLGGRPWFGRIQQVLVVTTQFKSEDSVLRMTEGDCCEVIKCATRPSSGADVGRLARERRDTKSFAVELGRHCLGYAVNLGIHGLIPGSSAMVTKTGKYSPDFRKPSPIQRNEGYHISLTDYLVELKKYRKKLLNRLKSQVSL